MSDLDRYQYGYDQNSNRLWKANVVGTAAVTAGLDEFYTYDSLNRLTAMQRGALNSGKTGITGTPSREMDYTLDPTGNWAAYLTKTNGATDLNQTRNHSTVNQITAIAGTPSWATPPTYDAAGNMNSFPQPTGPSSAYSAVYDAWNRLVSVSDTGGTVATYEYDGRNRRIVKNTTATSETRHFYYTDSWQDIEERVGTATTMDKQYVWGIRYMDELVCRDDATPQRLYSCQDANFNLTAITDTSGDVVERYVFDPYGNRTIMNASWTVLSLSGYNWVIGFQGLMLDEECGLVYVRNRYLQPGLGRLTEPDGGYWDGMNLYQYVQSNPVSFIDPWGFLTSGPPFEQHISPEQHKNYQSFTIGCPVNEKVANVKVTYPGIDDAILEAGWDPTTVHKAIASEGGSFGGVRGTPTGGCFGFPILVNTDMRTRLVGDSLQWELYRHYEGLMDGGLMSDIYAQNTILTYDCIPCCNGL